MKHLLHTKGSTMFVKRSQPAFSLTRHGQRPASDIQANTASTEEIQGATLC